MNAQKDAGKMKEERNLFLQLSDPSFPVNVFSLKKKRLPDEFCTSFKRHTVQHQIFAGV